MKIIFALEYNFAIIVFIGGGYINNKKSKLRLSYGFYFLFYY